jgi:hypothetical protein
MPYIRIDALTATLSESARPAGPALSASGGSARRAPARRGVGSST